DRAAFPQPDQLGDGRLIAQISESADLVSYRAPASGMTDRGGAEIRPARDGLPDGPEQPCAVAVTAAWIVSHCPSMPAGSVQTSGNGDRRQNAAPCRNPEIRTPPDARAEIVWLEASGVRGIGRRS